MHVTYQPELFLGVKSALERLHGAAVQSLPQSKAESVLEGAETIVGGSAEEAGGGQAGVREGGDGAWAGPLHQGLQRSGFALQIC